MNQPQPHDLLWGMPAAGLPGDAPAWAVQALATGQPVVVRRAACASGWVAVGVRGQGREQRLGGLVGLRDIHRQRSPQELPGGGEGARGS